MPDIVTMEAKFSIPCFFCYQTHESPYWDEVEEAILACRERHRKENGPEEWEEGSTITCELRAAIGYS